MNGTDDAPAPEVAEALHAFYAARARARRVFDSWREAVATADALGQLAAEAMDAYDRAADLVVVAEDNAAREAVG